MNPPQLPAEPLFHPLRRVGANPVAMVAINLNGRPLDVPPGSSVAAALLAAGVRRFRRSPVSGDGRAPYCMMGVCFECLLEIDGVPNRQSCLIPLVSGMRIRTQDDLAGGIVAGDDGAPGLADAMEASHGR